MFFLAKWNHLGTGDEANRTGHPTPMISVLNPPSSFGFFFPVSLDRLAEMMENPVGDDDTDLNLLQQLHELEANLLEGIC